MCLAQLKTESRDRVFVSLKNRMFASPELRASVVFQRLLSGPTQGAVGPDVSLLWLPS